MKMKRALVLFLILTAVQTAGNAEKARFLSEDGDKAYHSRHLEMHTGEETCRVCGNYLKVRRKPSGDSAVDGHAEQADLVQLLEIRGGWARIRVLYSAETSPDSAAGLEGWIDAAYLECACSERTYYAGGTDPVTGGSITAGGVNLRETPASGSRSLGKLARGQRVTVLGRYASGGKTMFRVVCKDGQNGFVSADYLDVGGEPPAPDYLRKSRAAAGTDAGVAGEAGAAYARAATERLRVRETPGGEIIGHISPADVLARYETKGKWTRISVVQAKSGYEDCLAGLSGWVSTEYLEVKTMSNSERVDEKRVSLTADSVFKAISGIEFCFSSGAGAWQTELYISQDGAFYGRYEDADMGDSGNDYPNGTLYECDFSGKLSVDGQLSRYSWKLHIDSLIKKTKSDHEYIENGVRHIPSPPYGLEQTNYLILYTPGMPVSELSEDFLSWAPMYEDSIHMYGYAIFNEEKGYAFR